MPDGVVLEIREDQTKMQRNLDGSTVETFADGTKIFTNKDGTKHDVTHMMSSSQSH